MCFKILLHIRRHGAVLLVLDARTDGFPDADADGCSDAWSDASSDTQIDGSPHAGADGCCCDAQSDARSDGFPEADADGCSDVSPDTRADGFPEAEADGCSDASSALALSVTSEVCRCGFVELIRLRWLNARARRAAGSLCSPHGSGASDLIIKSFGFCLLF